MRTTVTFKWAALLHIISIMLHFYLKAVFLIHIIITFVRYRQALMTEYMLRSISVTVLEQGKLPISFISVPAFDFLI